MTPFHEDDEPRPPRDPEPPQPQDPEPATGNQLPEEQPEPVTSRDGEAPAAS